MEINYISSDTIIYGLENFMSVHQKLYNFMWVGTSDIKFYLRGPGSMRSGIRFEIKIDKFRDIKFTAVSGAPNISGPARASFSVSHLDWYSFLCLLIIRRVGGGRKSS